MRLGSTGALPVAMDLDAISALDGTTIGGGRIDGHADELGSFGRAGLWCSQHCLAGSSFLPTTGISVPGSP